MTRINIIPPEELYDQHLLGEYREIIRIPTSLKRTLNSKKGLVLSSIPSTFKLNKGHVYFFYNKVKYVHNRYLLLIDEMKKRGFKPSSNAEDKFKIDHVPDYLYNDWTPSIEEQEIARERIQEKFNLKPNYYRKTKQQGT